MECITHGIWGAACQRNFMPFAIGSHYAVRTQALKAAGGIGPELDEDISTTYMISAAGYKGVFCLNASAHGEGPNTFEDAVRQEYQWARR
jgi:cellulose synthase (UDP-forming)